MKISDKIFFLTENEYRDTLGVYCCVIIACALTLGDQCKYLLSQLILRQCGGFEIPMNSKTDINLEEGLAYKYVIEKNCMVIMKENMS